MSASTLESLKELCCFLFQIPCSETGGAYQIIFKATHPLLSRLGILTMPDRRLCLGGKLLKGVVLPKNVSIQSNVIRQLVIWYLPCIKLTKSKASADTYNYLVNQSCFLRRENMLMMMLSKFPQNSYSELKPFFRLYN